MILSLVAKCHTEENERIRSRVVCFYM